MTKHINNIGGPCERYDCSNKTCLGYCKTTACIHPSRWIETKVIENEIPKATDMVDVVRCKNCKFWYMVDPYPFLNLTLQYGECHKPASPIRREVLLHEGWFCPDGERRE